MIKLHRWRLVLPPCSCPLPACPASIRLHWQCLSENVPEPHCQPLPPLPTTTTVPAQSWIPPPPGFEYPLNNNEYPLNGMELI